jgi:Ni,Fe-hydrogenase I small subunit
MAHFHAAADGQSAREFILVVEGSIPNEKNKKEGYWATFGTDQKTLQPILTCDWVDRSKAWAVIAAGTCSAYGGIPAMEGNPRLHGAAGLLGMEMEVESMCQSNHTVDGLICSHRDFATSMISTVAWLRDPPEGSTFSGCPSC